MTPLTLSLNAMATTFEVALHGDDPARIRAAGEEALQEIERLDSQLSFYNAASEISRVNARAAMEPVRIDPRVFRLLQRCVEISRLTDGAFDITVAPLMRAWGFTGGLGLMPDPDQVRRALDAVGMRHVILDGSDYTVRFDRPGVSIDLGAVGKGYAIERAVEILRECGVTSALIHGGTSTVYGIGAPPGQDAWRVAIRSPFSRAQHDSHSERSEESSVAPARFFASLRMTSQAEGEFVDTIDLVDCALSVSAVHGKSFTEGGVEYGHIIDPRTGQAKSGTLLAAVIGPSPTDSDALSTALLILGREWLPLLSARFPGYRGIVVEP